MVLIHCTSSMPSTTLTQNLTSNYSRSLTLQDGGYSPMYTDVTWWGTTAFSARRYHYTGKHTHNVLHFLV